MKYQRAPVWLSAHLENDSLLRTNRPHRCRAGRRLRAHTGADQAAPQALPVVGPRALLGAPAEPAAAAPAEEVGGTGLGPAVADDVGGAPPPARRDRLGCVLHPVNLPESLRLGHYPITSNWFSRKQSVT